MTFGPYVMTVSWTPTNFCKYISPWWNGIISTVAEVAGGGAVDAETDVDSTAAGAADMFEELIVVNVVVVVIAWTPMEVIAVVVVVVIVIAAAVAVVVDRMDENVK